MRSAAVVALVLGGCLSRPTGLPGDGGVDGPRAGQPWPPAGVVAGGTLARDVDGDGHPDLLITSAQGVYVLAGGPGFGAQYHAFVPTAVAPLAVELADVGGTAAPELVVLGVGGTTAGRVEIHPGLGGLAFDGGLGLDVPGIHPGTGSYRGVWLVDTDGDGRRNAVIADESHAFVAQPAQLTAQAVGEAALIHIAGPNSGDFIAVESVLTRPSGTGPQLVVVDAGTARMGGAGADRYDTTRGGAVSCGDAPDTVAAGDLDGDGAPELVVGYSGFIYGASLAAAQALSHPGLDAGCAASCRWKAIRLAELDRDPGARTDAVILRWLGPASTALANSDLLAVRNLRVSGALLTSSGTEPRIALSGLMAGVEVGDFDGDGRAEIVVVAPDGGLRCYRLGDTALDPC